MSQTIQRVAFGGGDPLDMKMSKAVIHNNTIYLAGTTASDELVEKNAGMLNQLIFIVTSSYLFKLL